MQESSKETPFMSAVSVACNLEARSSKREANVPVSRLLGLIEPPRKSHCIREEDTSHCSHSPSAVGLLSFCIPADIQMPKHFP